MRDKIYSQNTTVLVKSLRAERISDIEKHHSFQYT